MGERVPGAHDPDVAPSGREPELEFRTLSTFNAGVVGVYWAESGTSRWEQHPDGDELLQVVEGSVDIDVLDEGHGAVIRLSRGSIIVVPRSAGRVFAGFPINGGRAMTKLDSVAMRVEAFVEEAPLDPAQLSAAADFGHG